MFVGRDLSVPDMGHGPAVGRDLGSAADLFVGPRCARPRQRGGHVRRPDGLVVARPRTIVLISGGVGLTPMLSMLKTLVHRGSDAAIYFIHGTRNGSTHALAGEVDEIAAADAAADAQAV